MFLFEDSEHSPLSVYFRKRYGDVWCSERFVYVGGHDGFIPVIKTDVSKFYAAYVDITYDNGETIYAFNSLEPYARKGIVLPIPVINAEYYYVKQCNSLDLVYSQLAADTCLEFKPYAHIAKVKNFEKFCKWCTLNALKPCASLRGSHTFIEHDCPCDYPVDAFNMTLKEKSYAYTCLYPLAPAVVGKSIGEAATCVRDLCGCINNRFRLSPELFVPDPTWYDRWQTG